MDPVVKKTVCCLVILFIVAALTFTCVIIAKKPGKHGETFNNIHSNKNNQQPVENAIDADQNVIYLDHGKQTHGTWINEPKKETLDHPSMAAVNHSEESGVKPSSTESSGSSTTSHAKINDKQQKRVHLTQFDSIENDRVKVLNKKSSNVSTDESTGANSNSQMQTPSVKQTETSSKEPINNHQLNAEDTDINNPSSEDSFIPPVVNVENHALSQEFDNLSVNEPSSKDLTVISQNIESCNKNTQIHTLKNAEKQFCEDLSRFIVETIKTKEGNNRIAKGMVYESDDYKVEVMHVNSPSYVFKTNLNGKDLVIKYIKDISKMPNEAKMAREVRHENIVEVYHTFYTDDEAGFFIVLEAMDYDLLEWKKTHPDAIKDVVKCLVKALEYLHKNNIAHCGLKLKNILVKTVNSKPVYKLCDFGGAMYIYDDKKITPEFYYVDERYAAPETYLNGDYYKKTDIWLLGHTIWYYIKDENIFNSRNGQFNIKEYENYVRGPHLHFLWKNRPKIINDCCTKDPKKRASFNTILQWCNEED